MKPEPPKRGPIHTTREELGIEREPHYQVAIFDRPFLLREELKSVRIQLELLRPELMLRDEDINQGIVFFGSARMPQPKMAKEQVNQLQKQLSEHPNDAKIKTQLKRARKIHKNSTYLKQATQLAYLASCDEVLSYIVISGGGPGYMEAANRGAYEANARSVAFNMILPQEQLPNQFTSPELTFYFHYFALRKMHLLMRAKAVAIFPGGFGTFDELFEVLTLMQNKKIDRMPVLLFHKAFWKRNVNFKGLVEEGTIAEEDLDLFTFVETAEQAWDILRKK